MFVSTMQELESILEAKPPLIIDGLILYSSRRRKTKGFTKTSLWRYKDSLSIGKDKDARILNPQDFYFKKPLEYSLAIYCYYECFKCKKPYFGGAMDC